MTLELRLSEYIKDPDHPVRNYELGLEYDRIGQSATAVSFYIRAAEKTEDKELMYDCIVLAALCFHEQGRRKFTVEGLLQHAIIIDPQRPEAYLHLCRLYELTQNWRAMVVNSTIGMNLKATGKNEALQYFGQQSFKFFHALGSYNIGLIDSAKEEFFDIVFLCDDIEDLYKKAALNNITNLGYPDIIEYRRDKHLDLFKYKFDGLESINKNYAKHLQDMFILSCFNGKRGGTYVEIGAGDPVYTNNTYLLEEQFDWKGISFDNNETFCFAFAEKRKNPVLNRDVLKTDLAAVFHEHSLPEMIDYLQVDCDEVSLEVLKRVPFDYYEFGVIQFEHDAYRLGEEQRTQSRALLRKHGYVLLVENVAFNKTDAYEDWWVHPRIAKSIENMKSNSQFNFVFDYMIERKS